jgi:putative membrane-bound dehydrogenase-like protein
MRKSAFRLTLPGAARLLALAAMHSSLFTLHAAPSPLPSCPPDWKVELIAQAPQILHPSVLCAAPDGRLFVAQDPMDMGNPSDKPSDSILCFHPDGRVTMFATNLYAVFGLAYLDGKLYVHHTPKFTVFTDDHGLGRDPQDLFSTNPDPNDHGYGFNDHIPGNMRLAMDGYFYMATGDKGVYGAVGRDGSKAELHGGGIMRFRPDGTALEVYCTGTRNHLDVAINAEDELFTYDNTDDGNGWWTRVTHMVDGGFYGYPYDYKPRRPYTLWMMADYGGGSPTGAIAYNEDALPAEYHGNLFMCEWGKGELDRFVVERDGATYKIVKREVFLKRGSKEFRPVGIDVTPDGLGFYIADWNHGGWKAKQPAGRVLKVTYTGQSQASPKPKWYVPAGQGEKFEATNEELVNGLKHPSQRVRLVAQRRVADVFFRDTGSRDSQNLLSKLVQLSEDKTASDQVRIHAMWAIVSLNQRGYPAHQNLDWSNPRNPETNLWVRTQRIRAAGQQRYDQPPGPFPFMQVQQLSPLCKLLTDPSPIIRYRAAVALGRIGQRFITQFDQAGHAPDRPPYFFVESLLQALDEPDDVARFAVWNALNRIGRRDPNAWFAISRGLKSQNPKIREGTLFAMRETYDGTNVLALAGIVSDTDNSSQARAAALSVLAELHRQRPPWNGKWWATQPVKSPPPAKSVEWAGTPLVLATVREALQDPSHVVRRAAIDAVQITHDTNTAPRLRELFGSEAEVEARQAILLSLAAIKDATSADLIIALLQDPARNSALLPEAITAAAKLGSKQMTAALVELLDREMQNTKQKAESRNEKSLLTSAATTALLDALGTMKATEAVPALAGYLRSGNTTNRHAAANALARIGGQAATDAVLPLLEDSSADLRRLGVTTLGAFKNKSLIPPLLAAYADRETRSEAIFALAATPDLRALDAYLDGLGDKNSSLRDAARKGIEGIREKALPIIEEKLQAARAAPALPATALSTLQKIYEKNDKAILGPIFANSAVAKSTDPATYAAFALKNKGDADRGRIIFTNLKGVACSKCHKAGGEGGDIGPDLGSVGAKYSREQLIESMLFPSRLILDGYQQTIVFTKDGESTSGLLRGETAEELTLVDSEGRKNIIRKKDIDVRKLSEVSLMPEGLHLGLTLQDFADLVSFAENLKEAGATGARSGGRPALPGQK